MNNLFGGVYQNKRCLITGHTGFKGAWLIYWLKKLKANVRGYSLNPQTNPNHFKLLDLNNHSIIGNILDDKMLDKTISDFKPEIVFHLAAQSLVKYSYNNPIETYQTNVIGTLKVYEACRRSESVRAIINVTSDKCYENTELKIPYKEFDRMGGYDPYSSSKGCSELLTSSYRRSFLNEGNILLASVRAGNVIGGGDWSENRLVPDIVKSVVKKRAIEIRCPNSTRPWQHVLEPLSGYLTLGQKLIQNEDKYACGWNFGPSESSVVNVLDFVNIAKLYWPEIIIEISSDYHDHEAGYLSLDSSKAFDLFNWSPNWKLENTIEKTMNWYKKFLNNSTLLTQDDLEIYVSSAKENKIEWAT